MKPRHWHYWISLLLSIVLIPVLRGLHLPTKFNWIALGTAYWLVLAVQSIFVVAFVATPGDALTRWFDDSTEEIALVHELIPKGRSFLIISGVMVKCRE